MAKYIAFLLLVIMINCTGADSEPPTVNIIRPSTGEIVSGTVNIEVSATDNESVVRVIIYIDNNAVDTIVNLPYIYQWITTGLADSSIHTIQARAYDPSDNEGISATISVVVDNSGTCARIFVWNFDPFDKFYETAINDSVDCAYWLGQALAANGRTYQIGTSLPASLANYDIIFITLGWLRS